MRGYRRLRGRAGVHDDDVIPLAVESLREQLISEERRNITASRARRLDSTTNRHQIA